MFQDSTNVNDISIDNSNDDNENDSLECNDTNAITQY